MIEKMLTGAAGTLAAAMSAYCGWQAVQRITEAAWNWRSMIMAHAAWGTN